jgi:hypothetical protein
VSQPSPSHKEYIRTLLNDLREANRTVYRFDAKWQKINDELNNYLDRSGVKDPKQRDSIKGQSLALADALGTGKWWREKAMWLSQAILAEQAAINLLGGSQWGSSASQPTSPLSRSSRS